MNYRRKFIEYYKIFAVALLNICICFVLINVAFLVVFKIKDNFEKKTNPLFIKYGQQVFKKVYPAMSEREINSLLSETWIRPHLYEPFTQFKEKAHSSKYLNVDKNGFRLTKDQGPWPPHPENFNVFIFGGSTLFGYGVPDDKTIASYLQDFLSGVKSEKVVKVYNFGRGYYYSSQEFIFFERLLVSGFVPDLAIFVDGLNDFFIDNDEPFYTNQIKNMVALFSSVDISKDDFVFLRKLPSTRVFRIFYRIYNNLFTRGKCTFDEKYYNNKSVIMSVIKRYIQNKQIIEALSDIYSVKTVFVWQPIPLYKYDLRYHLFVPKEGWGQNCYSKYGYRYMAEYLEKNSLGENFLWCADMQEKVTVPLYVDSIHYTAEMSKDLARTICNLLVKRNLLISSKNETSFQLQVNMKN